MGLRLSLLDKFSGVVTGSLYAIGGIGAFIIAAKELQPESPNYTAAVSLVALFSVLAGTGAGTCAAYGRAYLRSERKSGSVNTTDIPSVEQK